MIPTRIWVRSPDGNLMIGSLGQFALYPAMSLEVAQADIDEEKLKGRVLILDEYSHARFIRLPDGKLYDNKTGITYASFKEYVQKNY